MIPEMAKKFEPDFYQEVARINELELKKDEEELRIRLEEAKLTCLQRFGSPVRANTCSSSLKEKIE
jgi:hypothetical protein